MQITIELDQNSTISLQNQVFEAIRIQILSGQLKPGLLMPSSRLMSEQLQVSRNTIILVYERLIDEGYLYSKQSVGTFVNPNLPEDSVTLATNKVDDLKQDEVLTHENHRKIHFSARVQALFNPKRDKLDIDFWVGRPDPESFPLRIWRQLMLRNLVNSSSSMTEYHDVFGIYELRKAIANHLKAARGISSRPEQVVITNGIQGGLNLVARLLIKPNDIAVMECPCYQGAAFLMESYGADLYPVEVDQQGIKVDKLPDKNVSLAYVTPSHQYPLGSTLSLERRFHLLEWARESGAYIIEDDYDSDFRHEGSPLTAVAGQDKSGHVIYMGTFSKSIGAALRIGYLVMPEELIESARIAKGLMDNGHNWLDQAVLKDFIIEGEYIKHLRRIRRTYLKRRDCLVSALERHFGNVDLAGLEGGMHLVWYLPDNLPAAREVQVAAEQVAVGVYSLASGAAYTFEQGGKLDSALLLGYSSTDEDQINEGIARLAGVLKS